MSTTYVGVDASVTGTGLAVVTDGKVIRTTTTEPKKLDGVPRLIYLRDNLLSFLSGLDVDGVCIEGYSFGSRANQAHKIGEWGGVLRVALVEAGHRLYIATPSTLKKFATGKGNTPGKGPMALALFKMTGLDLSEKDDEVDAALLALALDAKLNPERRKITAPQRDALDALEAVVIPRGRPRRGG